MTELRFDGRGAASIIDAAVNAFDAPRVAVVHTQGISKLPLTAEDIGENLDAIMDIRDARVTDTVAIEQGASSD